MRSLLTVLSTLALVAQGRAQTQTPFASSTTADLQVNDDWNLARTPPANATGHLIFDTVRGLLQHWPNTRYRNGHNIVPGIVPPGTLLYHGTGARAVPAVPEWTATDPEHSMLFCRTSGRPPRRKATATDSGCWHLTLAATRALRVLYFDGSSAAKMRGGPMDSQDLVAWGAVHEDRIFAERVRIDDLCKWAQGVGVDGFVRMEMDFEVMLCDFTAGVEVVSFLNLEPLGERQRQRGPPPTNSAGPFIGPDARVLESGSWHNAYPGDARIVLDYTRLITLYDLTLFPSLASARAGAHRLHHRLDALNAADQHTFRRVVDGEIRAWARAAGWEGTAHNADADPVGKGSGVDWRALFNTIAERYAARLEALEHVLNTSAVAGGSPARAHRHVHSMLVPYVLDGAVPRTNRTASNVGEDGVAGPHAWAAGVFEHCATAHARGVGHAAQQLTRGEKVLLGAAQDVLREICRVLVGVWAEGVEHDVGDIDGGGRVGEGDAALLARWHTRVVGLMEWLDWSGYWMRCRPACGFEEMCVLPTWPFFRRVMPGMPPRRDPEFMERVRDILEHRKEEVEDWEDPQPFCMQIVEALELEG